MTFRIVVGIDGSHDSLAALRWADSFAAVQRDQGRQTSLLAVKCWQPPSALGLDVFAITPNEIWQERAQDLLTESLQRSGVSGCKAMIRRGPAASTLLDVAGEVDAGLIVAGVRSGQVLEKFLLGSVSRRLASNGKRPVAVVPLNAPNFGAPTVVGFDGSDGSQEALRWAIDHCEGEVRPMMAWHLPAAFSTRDNCVDVTVVERGHEERLANGVRAALEVVPSRVNPLLRFDGARPMLVRTGDAAQVVVGSHRHRGATNMLVGSVAAYVAAHAPTAVIIVPPQG